MQGARVVGVDRECLLAAELSVEMPSGSQMAETGFVEFGSRTRADAVRSFLGFEAGYPAFTSLHACTLRADPTSEDQRLILQLLGRQAGVVAFVA